LWKLARASFQTPSSQPRRHPVWIEAVDPPVPLGARHDQPAVLEDLEVLGHRGTADRQLLGDLAHRARTASEELEDRATVRLAQQAD
jgi:hypothetical protein